MLCRIVCAHVLLVLAAHATLAQVAIPTTGGAAQNWQPPTTQQATTQAAPAATQTNVANQILPQPVDTSIANVAPSRQPVAATPAVASNQNQPVITRVRQGGGTLPRDHGQIWREYDISPYTARVTTTAKPEQAIVDWIIRETGTELWFSEPFGLLSASRDTVRVYHVPQVHDVVKQVIDRFVGSNADAYEFSIRLVTVNKPNWRARAHRMLQPVNVQSPGIQAWLLAKEDAAVLFTELQKRTDFRQHNSANLRIHNGQAGSLAQLRPKNHVKNVHLRTDVWPGYQVEMGQIEEGYTLEISPLTSLDGKIVDAVIKAHVDQVEKLVPVKIDVPTQLDPRQQVEIQVPQMVSWRVHERFRWPTDKVLLVSCGVVAKPAAGQKTALGIPNPFFGSPPRADALMLLESKGKAATPPVGPANTAGAAGPPAIRTGSINFHGRY